MKYNNTAAGTMLLGKNSRFLKGFNAFLFCFLSLILFVIFNSFWYGYQLQSNNRLEQEIKLLKEKLSVLNEGQSDNNVPKWNDEEYLLGHNHWIRGLGNTYLSNKDMESCIFPFVPYKLSKSQGLNNDPLFKEQHECYSWKFSKIHDRTITINCKNQKHGVYYFQNESLFISDHRTITDKQWIKFNKSDPKQYNKNHNQYILYLHERTQITWIKCNFHYNYHLSLLPMNKHLPFQYESLKRLHDGLYLKPKKPPNIVLFILDSTSRSNFIRGCPETVNYLSTLMTNKNSPVKVYQFFRHSTIGWGTSINLNGLLGGKPSGYSKNNDNLLSLGQFYQNMGYYVPGLYEWKSNPKYRAEWQEKWTFSLSKNFGNEYCWIKQRDDIEMYTEFILENINNLSGKDKLPYFLPLHSIANHAANGAYMFNLDRYFKKLVEYINFDNTILHIIGDHGCLVGDSTTTIFGRIEVKNPISILIIPKNNVITQKFDKYLSVNQQRMVTHYDFHRFYKTLPLLFAENGSLSSLVYQDLYDVEYQNIGKSLPQTRDNMKLAKSILTKYIPNDRSCDGIDEGFCFCDTKRSLNIDYNLNKQYYDKLMDLTINTINNLTGNGNWKCMKYSPKDFVIVLHLENEKKTNIEIVIEKKHDNVDEIEYKLLKKNNRWLTFVAEIRTRRNENDLYIPLIERSKWKIPAITRIDWFKYEDCLITHYNPYDIFPDDTANIISSNTRRNPLDGLHPIFKDYNLTRYVISSQAVWNLRVCTCN